MRALAAVFSHPDDETFAIGALSARYASEGVRCSLYCATDGDAGQSSGIPVSSKAALAALRREELRGACEILGIRVVTHGGHPDGALATVDPDVVMSEIVLHLRRERPDVVITFGPEGAPTMHRDHRAICRLATAAFLLAGMRTAFPEQLVNGVQPFRPARLCYVTWATPEPNADLPAEGQPTHIRIPIIGEWAERKRAAFEMHRSQHQFRARFEQLAMTAAEHLYVASGTAAPPGADDLFAGLP